MLSNNSCQILGLSYHPIHLSSHLIPIGLYGCTPRSILGCATMPPDARLQAAGSWVLVGSPQHQPIQTIMFRTFFQYHTWFDASMLYVMLIYFMMSRVLLSPPHPVLLGPRLSATFAARCRAFSTASDCIIATTWGFAQWARPTYDTMIQNPAYMIRTAHVCSWSSVVSPEQFKMITNHPKAVIYDPNIFTHGADPPPNIKQVSGSSHWAVNSQNDKIKVILGQPRFTLRNVGSRLEMSVHAIFTVISRWFHGVHVIQKVSPCAVIPTLLTLILYYSLSSYRWFEQTCKWISIVPIDAYMGCPNTWRWLFALKSQIFIIQVNYQIQMFFRHSILPSCNGHPLHELSDRNQFLGR